jgi:hypothetical protein
MLMAIDGIRYHVWKVRRSLYIPPRTFDLSLRRKYTSELDAHLHSKRLFLIFLGSNLFDQK